MRAAALLALSAVLVAGSTSDATTPQRARCEFDATGKIEPGLSSLVVPTARGTVSLAGTITCTGWAFGEDLAGRKGSVTLFARDDSGPTGAVGVSCVYADLDFAVRASFPERHGRPLVVSGVMNYLGEVFDGQLTGSLGGERLVGRAAIGSDPDGKHGLCTPEEPYVDLAMVGQLVLVDDRTATRTDHQELVTQDQYVTGGTANAIAVTTPSLFSTPVDGGDTITWTNADTHPHTVTACKAPCDEVVPVRTGAFDGDMLQPFTTFTLDTSDLVLGRYYYFCEYHPFMRGSFTVRSTPTLQVPPRRTARR